VDCKRSYGAVYLNTIIHVSHQTLVAVTEVAYVHFKFVNLRKTTSQLSVNNEAISLRLSTDVHIAGDAI
jgi:hypothetical protein